ncbi:hypothetical protein RJ639_006414 [Escallonia herrerae]|uniref:Cytochrome P450 n=1 Tax=Escallonia herrerae TaxID=1293975 RepID=A0AA88W1D4_9ASTE|nr:hypothetical protein RJ639_006414 [Escallonia herrerae]
MLKIGTLELLSNRRLELLKHVRSSELDRCIKDTYSLSNKNAKNGSIKLDMTQWFVQVTMNIMMHMIAENDIVLSAMLGTMRNLGNLEKLSKNLYVIPFTEWMDLQGRLTHMKQIAEILDYYNLISAGSDTSSVTMTWALSLLLNHNKELKKAQKDINIHVGQERWMQESDIKNLVYLQAIFKETMRLYPAGPLLVPREAVEDCYVAAYYVTKGTRLLVNAWKLHRDPNIWIDPCKFQPERFVSSHAHIDIRGLQFEYIPFSSGRRSCLGITSSMQVMHLAMARLLQGFDLATPMNVQVDMSEGLGLALHKVAPLEVVLTSRLPRELYQNQSPI